MYLAGLELAVCFVWPGEVKDEDVEKDTWASSASKWPVQGTAISSRWDKRSERAQQHIPHISSWRDLSQQTPGRERHAPCHRHHEVIQPHDGHLSRRHVCVARSGSGAEGLFTQRNEQIQSDRMFPSWTFVWFQTSQWSFTSGCLKKITCHSQSCCHNLHEDKGQKVIQRDVLWTLHFSHLISPVVHLTSCVLPPTEAETLQKLEH